MKFIYFSVAGVFMVTFGGIWGIIRAQHKLHQDLLSNAVKFPMAIFDTIPKGRILNRFSTDLDIMDEPLRFLIIAFFLQSSAFCSTILAVGYTTPIFLSVAVFLLIIYIALQVKIASRGSKKTPDTFVQYINHIY